MLGMYILMFVLGVTTTLAVMGVIALKDWYKRGNKKETEEELPTKLRETL